jgi:hypothetical protein
VIIDSWSKSVTAKCHRCYSNDGVESCLRDDGKHFVPSPFVLICMSQLSMFDATVRAYLELSAQQAVSDAALWADVDCAEVPPSLEKRFPGDPPPAGERCLSNEFGCPDGRTGTACDNERQCLNGEDERFCGPISETFVCHHGEKVPWSLVCDGVSDCPFADDELTCYAGLTSF